MTLTKEWLLKTISELEEERDAIPGAVNEDAANALAAMKLALASLEADAVACPKCNGTGMADSGGVQPWGEPINIPCDCTAQPAPVVPDEIESTSGSDYDAYYCDGWNACRAAMLQGAEPVQEWIPCSERMPETDGNYWGWWSESKRQGPVWFIKTELQAQFQSSEITHWMPLPAAPHQEV